MILSDRKELVCGRPPGAMESVIAAAVEAFSKGNPVMIFDSSFREQETDLLWPASCATPKIIRRLRQDCGGLLFLAIGNEIGDLFGLPWLQDIHSNPKLVETNPVLGELITDDLRYDSKSAFTLSLNHRKTFTGITDKDRALTTRRFGELASELLSSNTSNEGAMKLLGDEFRTPGHIPLCRESPGGLNSRQGHTELAVSIARLAGLPACTIGAEMLQPNGDGALSVSDAMEYAKNHDIPMLMGKDVLEAFKIN